MTQQPTSVAVPFEQEAVVVLRAMRSALTELITAMPGGVRGASELQRRLGIDSKLAWRLFKVVNTPDPMTAGCHIPTPTAMTRFLRAVAKKKLPSALIESATRAANDFERLVETHAGDRAVFDSMISSFAEQGSGKIDLEHKRAAFRANTHLWGVQARTQLTCMMIRPAADPDMLDIALLNGLVDLRRLRVSSSCTVSRVRIADNDGEVRRPVTREPLDPAAQAPHGLALMPRFCSSPTPEIRTYPAADGFVCAELGGNDVGNASAVTCMMGDVCRNAGSRYQDEHNRFGRCVARVRMPCEVLIHDMLLFGGMYGDIKPEVFVYGDIRGQLVVEGRKRDLLPMRESVDYLGPGPSVLHTPDVPRYAEMAQYAFDTLGWDGDRFDVYRCRVEYPVMPSSVVVQFDLPERPQA